MHLGHVAEEIQHRLQHLMARDHDGRRAINAGNDTLDFDPHWKDYLWFFEFFDGDTGRGLGASHQCGWTGLMAKMIHDTGINCRLPQTPRTPSTGLAHYFDDTFSSGLTRKNTFAGGTPGPMRRSSTSRSLGNRSSFVSTATNGDHFSRGQTTPAVIHDVDAVDSYFDNAPSVVTDGDDWGEEDKLERERRKSVADSHFEKFVNDQLTKIKTDESVGVYEDEFEAQLD